jgi:tartrate dehydratase alpha subunit/fumarate hydratase class I-like protein
MKKPHTNATEQRCPACDGTGFPAVSISAERDCRVSNVKYTDYAFNKTTVYKRKSRNHLSDQIESFRIGDKDNKREDDLLDTFCYGIAIALGNSEGF